MAGERSYASDDTVQMSVLRSAGCRFSNAHWLEPISPTCHMDATICRLIAGPDVEPSEDSTGDPFCRLMRMRSGGPGLRQATAGREQDRRRGRGRGDTIVIPRRMAGATRPRSKGSRWWDESTTSWRAAVSLNGSGSTPSAAASCARRHPGSSGSWSFPGRALTAIPHAQNALRTTSWPGSRYARRARADSTGESAASHRKVHVSSRSLIPSESLRIHPADRRRDARRSGPERPDPGPCSPAGLPPPLRRGTQFRNRDVPAAQHKLLALDRAVEERGQPGLGFQDIDPSHGLIPDPVCEPIRAVATVTM